MREKINAVLAQEDKFLQRAKKQMKYPFLMDFFYVLMDNTSLIKQETKLFQFLDKYCEREIRLGQFEHLAKEGRITDGNIHGFFKRQKEEAELEFEDMKAVLAIDPSSESRKLLDKLDPEILECDLFKGDFEWMFKRMESFERFQARQTG